MSRICAICIGLFLSIASGSTIALPSIELEHNPFSYLDIKTLKPNRKTRTTAAVARAQWRPELRATIIAGKMSVANVAGKVVRIGEKLDGYTLITVSRQSATFEKNQSRVILKMTLKRKKK